MPPPQRPASTGWDGAGPPAAGRPGGARAWWPWGPCTLPLPASPLSVTRTPPEPVVPLPTETACCLARLSALRQ